MKDRVSVTWLAAFFHRRGDLHPGIEGRTRSEEGIRAQRALQTERLEATAASGSPGYQRERAVALTLDVAGREIVVGGRIDGVDLTGDPALVEEFKTTRADHGRMFEQNGDEHWAQARLYAGMLAREGLGAGGFLLRLCYCNPDSMMVTAFEERVAAGEALAFLDATLESLRVWLERQAEHERARDARLGDLPFPYGEFRPYQRAMARRAYRALRDRERLLLEAPTGSGKTAAMLYPAVRALASTACQRIFFLTSRSTGAHAALDALLRMDPEASWLRYIQITAREQACLQERASCDRHSCPFALGYFDRSRDAVLALLERRAMTPETIRDVARAHRVCPHELSLDAALWSDVVIGDYNYLFDPVVRLQRFAGERDAAILVDEAHQLAPRVRDMLSLSLSRDEIRDALAESPPDQLAKRLRGIDRQLVALARRRGQAAPARRDGATAGEPGAAVGLRELDGSEWVIESPVALLRALQRFCDTLYESAIALEPWPATLQVFFNAARWLRDAETVDPQRWVYRACSAVAGATQFRIALDCLDPGPWIAERLGEYGGHVRFSGTVSPMPMYQMLHGFDGEPVERAGNPFRPEQLAVLLVGDIPTYLQSRSRSLGKLVELVNEVALTRSGHYLVAFPSFEYLRQFAEAFATRYPRWIIERQAPGMAEQQRQAFLAAFRDDASPRIGLVVLGGVFGESVDFSGTPLAGVICVGLGLPPPSLTRDALAGHFDRLDADGRTIAYLQPAMVKVVQMAGRLLRSPDDRGVLCLVDPRFADPECQQFFPGHWPALRARAAEVPRLLANFWQEAAGFPRLRASEQESPT